MRSQFKLRTWTRKGYSQDQFAWTGLRDKFAVRLAQIIPPLEWTMTEQPLVSGTSNMCPECPAGPFKDPRGLSAHRRIRHGIKGNSPSAIAARKATAHHPVRTKIRVAVHERELPPNGRVPEEDTVLMSPELMGYAVGKYEALAQQIARDNNVPEKEFAVRTSEYFAAFCKR